MTTANDDTNATEPQPSELGFDPDALRKRYREERDKRIRPDGNEQYVETGGEHAHFADDPYVEPGYTREPLTDEIDVALIGGGFGGLLAGARLRQAGVEDIRIIEKGGDFGGTWYWNRYPGAACDIESYIYLPLLEELDYVPKEKYSRAPEIFAHAKAIAEKFDLYRNACLQTEVTELRWDEERSRWIISTNRGDAMKARFVCLSNGFLQKPKLPGIPGVESFQGHAFHTSRWDYGYTGGDAEGKLTGLRDKRVGIIGTGASAVQIVPHVGESAGHLYVFQRTPSSVGVRDNHPTDAGWASKLETGWHQKRMDNFQILTAGGYQEKDLVSDGWTDIIRKLLFVMQSDEDADLSPEGLEKSLELADFMQMEQIRARVDSVVEDPATAEALKPYYRQFCKRPCFHDGYLPTFNRPNVTLVDTQGAGVERVTEKGVVVGGKEYELDCLIYGTGFEVGTDYARRAGFDLIGRKGMALSERWSDGVRTLHGLHIRGFPNCFMMSIAQSGLTVNFPYMINEQAKHIAYIVERALGDDIRSLEVTEAAETEWVDSILELADGRAEFAEQCTPGYYNNEGKPGRQTRQNFFYMGGPTEFVEILEAWRADGKMEGLELG
ncbi:MAG: NAD(P)/FAD-dependent oxidoreductase [Deltaproteobacteria bacterium]|nr:NAD(P)/FAD-dependent oxidoreductase [Deltaproteobacteria bacterium]